MNISITYNSNDAVVCLKHQDFKKVDYQEYGNGLVAFFIYAKDNSCLRTIYLQSRNIILVDISA